MNREDLLKVLQEHIPFVERPFLWIAERLGASEEEVLKEIEALKEQRIIRQISPIYDTKAAGYDSSLVAFRVDDIERAAQVVNTYPGVSHNYERNHEFNLWFTVAVPPDSKLGLEGVVSILAQEAQAQEFVILRTVRTFKIGVKLSFESMYEREEVKPPKEEVKVYPITEGDKRIIRETQGDIPLTPEPFKDIALRLEMDQEDLLKRLENYKEKGLIRRFSAILFHRRAGFKFNGMVVWSVPRERVEEVGTFISSFRCVSHCYERQTGGRWRYNLFSMIHARTREELEEFVSYLSKEVGVEDYEILLSTSEFKKKRVELFAEGFYEWERRYMGVYAH